MASDECRQQTTQFGLFPALLTIRDDRLPLGPGLAHAFSTACRERSERLETFMPMPSSRFSRVFGEGVQIEG